MDESVFSKFLLTFIYACLLAHNAGGCCQLGGHGLANLSMGNLFSFIVYRFGLVCYVPSYFVGACRTTNKKIIQQHKQKSHSNINLFLNLLVSHEKVLVQK